VTNRQVGETGIKLIGVYFAAEALLGVTRLLALLVMPAMEGMPRRDLLIPSALAVAGVLLAAALCLLRGETLARRLFGGEDAGLGQLSRRDLLAVGLALLGVSLALSGVPALLQFAGRAIWYSEASRQSQFQPVMERLWEPLAASTIAVLVGCALAVGARRLAAALDGVSRRD
jgi:hypothetical protein